MDEAFGQFFSWHSVVMMMACYIATLGTRRVVETAMPSLVKKADENAEDMTYATNAARWYQQVVLYLLPIVWGIVLSVSMHDLVPLPFPDGVNTTKGYVLFGTITGFFSAFAYKIIRRALITKFNLKEDAIPAAAPGSDRKA